MQADCHMRWAKKTTKTSLKGHLKGRLGKSHKEIPGKSEVEQQGNKSNWVM